MGSARGVGIEQALAMEEGIGLLSHADTDEGSVDSLEGRRVDRPTQEVGTGVGFEHGQDSKSSN